MTYIIHKQFNEVNRWDRLLFSHGLKTCRYVIVYCLFRDITVFLTLFILLGNAYRFLSMNASQDDTTSCDVSYHPPSELFSIHNISTWDIFVGQGSLNMLRYILFSFDRIWVGTIAWLFMCIQLAAGRTTYMSFVMDSVSQSLWHRQLFMDHVHTIYLQWSAAEFIPFRQC